MAFTTSSLNFVVRWELNKIVFIVPFLCGLEFLALAGGFFLTAFVLLSIFYFLFYGAYLWFYGRLGDSVFRLVLVGHYRDIVVFMFSVAVCGCGIFSDLQK